MFDITLDRQGWKESGFAERRRVEIVEKRGIWKIALIQRDSKKAGIFPPGS